MEAIQPWYTRPVFLSSTFKDMHAERDHLREHVFPKLAEDLRARRCHLETIDLRMGVETVELGSEEEKELRVLKVCLNEIERSRPFLLVFLGDRYGWVPPESRMRAAATEAGFFTEVSGKSVTALEIEFGILLKDPEQRRRCLFFFRDPLPYDAMFPEVAAQYSDAHSPVEAVRASHTKLVLLKQEIEVNLEFRPRVHHYRVEWDKDHDRVTGLKDFGELVARKLWDELEPETSAFAQQAERTWEDVEREALAEFVEQRGRDFVGRDDITRELLALARSPTADRLDPVESKPETIRLPVADPLAALSFTVHYDAAGVVESTPRRSVTPSDPEPSSRASKDSSSAKSVAWGVCITGDPGSGKSALFAHLYHRIHGEPDIVPLAHAAGISPRATSVDSMLRRWIGELAGFLRIRSPLPENASAEDVETTFASLLGQASAQTRVVVLIDALNQFEPTTRARFLTWLPKLWPVNARLIVTTLTGDQAEVLRSRDGVDVRDLPPLSGTEAMSIAEAVCARYHRTMNPDVLRVLTTKLLPDGIPAAGNPLWLTLAVEQLNLLDEDDFARADREFTGTPEQRLHRMVLDVAERMPADVAGLYGWLLDQTEKVHGTLFARAFADLIALSRFGWRESDLRSLVPTVGRILFPSTTTLSPIDPLSSAFQIDVGSSGIVTAKPSDSMDYLKLAALRRGFRAHIARRGQSEQWDFFHLQMRQAILQRNLGDPAVARRLHLAIADHLETLSSTDPFRQSELMVHLIGADDRPRAARHYGIELTVAEKAGATRALANYILTGTKQEPNPDLAWVVSLLDQLGNDPICAGSLCTRFNFDLSDAIANDANLATRYGLLAAAEHTLTRLVNQDPSNLGWQRNLSASHINLGEVLEAQGDSAGALKAHRASLAICERLAMHDPNNAALQFNLSVSHDRVGDVLVAQGDAAGALQSYRASLAICERLAAHDPNNAALQRNLSWTHSRLGDVLVAQGDAAGGLKAHRASLAICERLAAQDPSNAALQRNLSVSHSRLGDMLVAQGDAAGGLKAHRASLAICERLATQDPSNADWQRNLSVSHDKLGDMLVAQGDAAGALQSYRASLVIREQLATQDPSNASWQHDLSRSHNNVSHVLLAQGDAAGALRGYRAFLAICERLAAQDPSNAAWQRDLSVSREKVGDVLVAQGDAAGALQSYQASLAIREQLATQDPSNADWQRDLSVSHSRLGDMLVAQGDAAGGLKAYRASLAIRERLATQDPSNALWQRDLSVSCVKIANVLEIQRDREAINWWRRAYDILAEMSRRGLFVSPADQRFLEQIRAKVGR